jgi:two-component system nitrogen regulation sensor histidine kinase GlnL
MVTGRRSGTGLGLALVQQIAADHGGLVTYTALERGSRFTIHLPLSVADEAQPAVPEGDAS